MTLRMQALIAVVRGLVTGAVKGWRNAERRAKEEGIA